MVGFLAREDSRCSLGVEAATGGLAREEELLPTSSGSIGPRAGLDGPEPRRLLSVGGPVIEDRFRPGPTRLGVVGESASGGPDARDPLSPITSAGTAEEDAIASGATETDEGLAKPESKSAGFEDVGAAIPEGGPEVPEELAPASPDVRAKAAGVGVPSGEPESAVGFATSPSPYEDS